MGLDEQLLNRQDSGKEASDQRIGALNRARRNSGKIDSTADNNSQSSFDFNTVRHQAQLNKLGQEKKENKVVAALVSPIKKGTNQVLKQSWLNLIDSFGLTLIWINIHVFLKYVLGEELFCKLGEEWTGGNFSLFKEEKAKKSSKLLNLTEGMGLVTLDFIVLMLVLLFLFLVYLILTANPVVLALKQLVGNIWGFLSGK